ncbi:Ni,Fe-hydrogenase maturation factor [Flavobacterium arsenatis]|uniref:Ni,Fe-hydrogenase maturation factor n=1 Tax=Flavobacterium arsenatis TaxID=1484332 RepID=A0ABU1TJC9_9FLAO|nr:hypothetical protein [Flavobacterium arsenatis]MDR6966091.1 Ni,Fe-hydrogenase maturation factor [Flavobacterium arsenatis]
MKKEEVPQDKSSLSSIKMKELCYATDEKGNYTTALSTGWEPKTIALENSIQEVNERIEEANQNVKNGKASPIVYFMEVHKMDWLTLSSYVNMWKWRVKRHAKPSVFNTLTNKILSKYAEAFEISVEELKNFKGN